MVKHSFTSWIASFLVVTALVFAALFVSGAGSSARADSYMGMTLDCGSNGSKCATKNPVRAFFSDSLGQKRANSAGLDYGLATWFPAGAPWAITPICYDVYADDPTALNLTRRVAANVCFQPELSCPHNQNSCVGGTQAWRNPITFSSTVPYSAGRHSISIRRLWVPWTQINPQWDYVSTIYFDVQQHADLTAAAGTPQSAQVLQPFAEPLQVLVKDEAGQPLPNTLVTFTKEYAPPYYAMANLSSMTATTNAQGIASVTATANGYGGSYSITATTAGSSVPVTFALTNSGSPTHMQIVGGSAQSTPMLAAFPNPLQVRVTDDAGNPTSGVPVTFTPHYGPPNYSAIALLSSQTVNTNNNGIASVTASANGYSGSHTVTVSASGVIESPVFTLSNHGAGSQIYLHGGNNQAAQFLNNFAAPLEVLVTDDVGTPASGVRVDFTTQYLPPNYSANAVLGSTSAITDSMGVARISASANGYSGDHAVIATIHGSSASTTFSLRNHGAANKFGPATGTPQSAKVLASYATPLQVQIMDDVGSPASGTVVTFAAPSDGASVSLNQQTVTTGPDGLATVTATANGQPGAFEVTASIPGATTPFRFALTNLQQDIIVSAITPATGDALGGTAVTISGAGFTGATSVTIGGAAATDVTVVDDTTITATTPSGTAGTASVVVTTPNGANAANTLFRYEVPQLAPTVTAINPATGPPSGGTLVTVTGTGFTGASAVTWNGAPGTDVVVVSDTTITAKSPPGSVGQFSLQVVTPAGTNPDNTLFSYVLGTQVVAFTSTAPTSAIFGGTYTPTATGGAGTAPVVISVSGTCSIVAGVVSFTGAGTCIVSADQEADANFAAAPQAQQSITVGKAAQIVAFTSAAPALPLVGGTYSPTATGGGSTAPVAFSIGGTSCTLANGVVTFVSAGVCTVNADQAGDDNYEAASQVQQSITIGKAAQIVAFTSAVPASPVVSGTYTPTALGGASTSPVVIAASGSCGLSNGIVSFNNAGTCTITADQAGDDNYVAAPQVQQLISINASNAGPTANAGAAQVVKSGDPVTLDGSQSSDPENDQLTYSWTQTSGTSVILSDSSAKQPVFTAPALPTGYVSEVLVFVLAVSDGKNSSPPASVSITVNQALIASLSISNGTPLIGQTEDLVFELQSAQRNNVRALRSFSAVASSGAAVQFLDNGNVVAGCSSVPLIANVATCSWVASGGEHVLTATIINSLPNASTIASNQLVVTVVNQNVTQSRAIGGFLSDRTNQIVTNMFDMNRQIDRLNEARGGETKQGDSVEQQFAVAKKGDIALPVETSRLGAGPTAASITAASLETGTGVGQQDMLGLQSFLYNYLKSAGETGNFAQFKFSGPMDLSASYGHGNTQAFYKASLSQLINWKSQKEQEEMASLGLALSTSASSFVPFDIWAEGTYSGFAGERSGHFGMLTLGADYVFNPNILAGIYGQFDTMKQTSGSDISGKGWMAGPYATVRLGENVFWQVRGGWGKSYNAITATAAGADSFDSTRWMLSSSLSGQWSVGNFSFAPTASFSYFEDNTKNYVDHFGVTIPGVSTSLGQLKLSPDMSYGFETESGVWIEPGIAPELIWNFAQTGAEGLGALEKNVVGPEGLRGRVKAGVKFRTTSGLSINLSGSYDGIGTDGYSSFSGQADVNIPLN